MTDNAEDRQDHSARRRRRQQMVALEAMGWIGVAVVLCVVLGSIWRGVLLAAVLLAFIRVRLE